MFNVFKRPMFRRGGSPTGTGIMSHVEPRKNFNAGARGTGASNMAQFLKNQALRTTGRIGPNPMFGPPNPGYVSNMLAKYPRALPLGAYGAAGGAGYGIGALTDFAVRATDTPLAYAERKKIMEEDPYTFDETNDPSAADMRIENLQSIGEQPGFFPRGGRKNFYRKKDLNPETGLPYEKLMETEGEAAKVLEGETALDAIIREAEAKNKLAQEIKELEDSGKKDPKYVESDNRSSFEKEKELLDKMIPGGISKAEKALLIGKAFSSPGSIADKIDIAGSEGMKLLKDKKQRDRAIAKLAYTGSLQKDIAEISADKKGFTEKQFSRIEKAQNIINNPKSSAKDKAKAQESIKTISSAYKALSTGKGQGLSTGELKTLENIDNLVKKISKATPGTDKYNLLVNQYLRAREIANAGGSPGLIKGVEIADIQLGVGVKKKDGGRIGYSLGTNPMEAPPEMAAMSTKAVSSEQVPTEEVSKNLSFEELRNRLPKEITDDVVNLIKDSNEALQDFSYIRTQGDVNKFNMKYGVNLVLPAQT